LPSRHEAKRIANQERLLALGNAVERRAGGPAPSGRSESRGTPKRGKAPRSTARRWSTRLGLTAAVLALVVVIAGVADYYYLGSLINHKHVNFLQSGSGPENILMIGSTDRCAYKVQNPMYGICQNGVNGINSDIVMVLHLNPATGQAALLSIPRDTFIPNARTAVWGYANKIDAALLEGPSQLVDALEEDFGIPINHYVELNFSTFADVVNALGGVKMYFPVPVWDGNSGLHISFPGCYQLDGKHALQVVRARHLQIDFPGSSANFHNWPQESLSDIARIRRTHEFLRVLAAKIAANGLSNPITDQNLAASVIGSLQVDQNFSESHMIGLARTFANINISSLPQLTYPVASVVGGSYLYKGYYYGDVTFPMNPTGSAVLQKIFGVGPRTSTFNYKPLPANGSFAISVENGSNTPGQASTIQHGLSAQGFRVTSIGTRTPVGIANETVIWYGGAAPPAGGNWVNPGLEAAQAVARRLSGPVVLGYNPAEVTPGALVTVQTGNGLSVIPVPVATTAKTTTTVGATTNQSQNSNSSILEPTTPTSQGLQPWDPRPCSPGQRVYVDHSAA